ncbi:MAG: hypothetical protein AAF657_33175 [Acidobacteriota bacterium]
MAKLSTEITGKLRSGLFLLSALSEQGPAVAELLLAKARESRPEGEPPADFLSQIEGLGHILEAALDRMVEHDRLLYRESESRAALLEARDDLVASLGRRITGIRRVVSGHYVDPKLAPLGLVGDTAREPIALLRQTELICDGLKREDLKELLGTALFEPPLDLGPYVPQIEPGIETLRLAFEAHQGSRRRVDELLAKKKESVEDYETAFLRVARQFEDLCLLVGQKDLAEKVRPSLTRRGETQVEPEANEAEASSDDTTVAGDGGGEPLPPTTEPAAEPATEGESDAPSPSSSDSR